MTTPSFARTARFAPHCSPLINLTPTIDGLFLHVAGELDIATVPRLDGVIAALERAPRSVHVDLAAVRFADAAGLSPLFDSAERRMINGLPPLIVRAVSRAVQRVVELLADDIGVRAFAAAVSRRSGTHAAAPTP
jgi:anti-anti-sigma factor